MCVDHSLNCSCGKTYASFHFRDEVLPFDVVNKLFCPECAREVIHNPETMVADNGWLIEFDMDIARFMMQKKAPAPLITPEYLFDEGFCTWRGMTPTDHIDSVKEREALVQLAKTDPKRYFEEMRTWGNTRMERLAREGWRKAIEREPAKT